MLTERRVGQAIANPLTSSGSAIDTVIDYRQSITPGGNVVTMQDVADAAGVSTATVSRFLAGHRVNNASTIKQVVERLGYRPNPHAAGLRTGTHQTIGVVSPDTSNSLLAEIVKGIQVEARQRGFRVLVGDSNEDASLELELMDDLGQRSDGLLVFPVNEERDHLTVPSTLPIVLVDRDAFRGQPHDLVAVDNERGARLAVEHLAGLGHVRIATITGPLTSFPGRLRFEGFRAAMASLGLPVPETYVVDGGFHDETGARAMHTLLGLSQPPTAAFVANNAMTIGAYSALRERGLGLPDEFSLVGFDDFRLADLLTPAVTVVDRPTEAQGRTAAQLLFRRITERAGGASTGPVRLNLDVHLRIRDSTGPAPKRQEHP